MPAELVWSCDEYWHQPCFLVRGYGEMYHVVEEGRLCPHSDIPLLTLAVDGNQGRFYVPLAVTRDGKRIALREHRGSDYRALTVFDTESRTRTLYGHLGDDDGIGLEVCEASNGKVYAMAALAGLSIFEVGDKGVTQRNRAGATEGFEAADPEVSYWDGWAKSISTYGDMVAVGGFQSRYVELFDLSGKSKTVIGPQFSYQGRDYRFADREGSFPYDVEGVFVDRWQRIWVAPDPGELVVFSAEGECLYVVPEGELSVEEGMTAGFHWPWGVDARGLLWCNAGRTAFRIPELMPLDLAPTLPPPPTKRSGFEPTLGGS